MAPVREPVTIVVRVPTALGRAGPYIASFWLVPTVSGLNCSTRSSVASDCNPILNWYRTPGSKNVCVPSPGGMSGNTSIANTTFDGSFAGNTYTSVMSVPGRDTVSGES